ncbi:glycoside hydrolase N-terminal domain-containing protein [Paenibacillus sp. HWE-109]|uniref:glycosyl hydrolase family 95 catalytic domain-containing protein n=1 Tax=Paenibacillus sp. HWE-109 TaxID=1306526 RepID=UPI001EDCF204|nr:glycoside hydrolase N-terminal domain-containing protein [Paenibacillus sp. HWE-109]UKS26982.1 glycoside hydrolase N-terminal domain-containing protein [Paenibacillus sp. HWE-109]
MIKRIKILLVAALGVSLLASGVWQQGAYAISGSTTLPKQKAGNWEQLKYTWTTEANGNDFSGTVIGNGRIGARVAGGVATDTLQLNDKTFWSGEPGDVHNASRITALAETRRLLAEADTATSVTYRETKLKAAEEAAKGMWGRGSYASRYLPIGKLMLDVPGTTGFTSYSRELDLDRATVTTKYKVGTTTYTREVFASYPDNVIVMRISNNENKPMSMTARFTYPAEMTGHAAVQSSGNEMTMTGTANYNLGKANSLWAAGRGMTFDSRLRVKTTGGTITPTNGNLAISGASEIILTYANATSYKDPFTLPNPSQGGNDPAPIVTAIMNKALVKSYGTLLNSHLDDYRKLFRRLWVEVNGNTGTALDYIKTYQYSRYEMISVSRENTTDRPRNQQGMWNHEWIPETDSSHFLNENVEKHYANIETANLTEMGDPLWKWIKNLAISGAQTAQQDFGFDGWMAPHYSDIWAATPLADTNNEWAIWPMGGIWLMNTVYEHYLFTKDKTFLQNTAYPLMKGAAEFALDLLVTNKDGYLVTSPSTSPENKYKLSDNTLIAVSQGSTMDMSLIRQLFRDVLEAASVLQANSADDLDLINRITAATPHLLPFAIGSQGELKEWNNDYPGKDPLHRHASHLVGLNLRDVLTKRGTPNWFEAARKSMELRGTGATIDKSYMWARLGEPDKALQAHKLFQIDPNRNKYQTISAYVPELFLQSHAGEIELLPSLPTGWSSGKIVGVKARGGYELSIEWANGQLVSAQIDSPFGTKPIVRYQNQLLNVDTDPRIVFVNSSEVIVDNTAAQLTGTWMSSTTLTNYYGANYLYASTTNGTNKIKWTPNLPYSGTYKVYYKLPNGNISRATNAPFNVHDTTGDHIYYVNQQVAPSPGWVSLGNFTFTSGTNGYVELTNNANNDCVNADAVKFEYVSP